MRFCGKDAQSYKGHSCQYIYNMWEVLSSLVYCPEVPQLCCQSVLLHTKEYDEHRNMKHLCLYIVHFLKLHWSHIIIQYKCDRSLGDHASGSWGRLYHHLFQWYRLQLCKWPILIHSDKYSAPELQRKGKPQLWVSFSKLGKLTSFLDI